MSNGHIFMSSYFRVFLDSTSLMPRRITQGYQVFDTRPMPTYTAPLYCNASYRVSRSVMAKVNSCCPTRSERLKNAWFSQNQNKPDQACSTTTRYLVRVYDTYRSRRMRIVKQTKQTETAIRENSEPWALAVSVSIQAVLILLMRLLSLLSLLLTFAPHAFLS